MTTTHTTSHLTLSHRQRLVRWVSEQDRWMLGGLSAIVLLIAVGTLYNYTMNRAPAAPIIILATPVPTPALPTSAPAAREIKATAAEVARLPHAIIAYSAPDESAVINAVEPGRAFTVTEVLDGTWAHTDLERSGLVWFRVIDLAGLAGVPNAVPPPAEREAPAAAVMAAPPAAARAAVPPAVAPTMAPPPTAAPSAATPSWMVLQVESPSATPAPAASDFADSFKEPTGPNPFVGCLTAECRRQFGQESEEDAP